MPNMEVTAMKLLVVALRELHNNKSKVLYDANAPKGMVDFALILEQELRDRIAELSGEEDSNVH